MKKVKSISSLISLCITGLSATGTATAAQYIEADTIYRNGNIITMSVANDIAHAVAVKDGKVIAVGGNSAVHALSGKNTEFVNLHGKTMIPGFVDAHSHFSWAGTRKFQVDLNSPPIGSTENIDGIVNALMAAAKTTPPGTWIRGSGYDDTLLAEKRHPTREDLDRASTQHPILITHVSGHLVVANSLALRLAGITADTPNPPGGIIQKDSANMPNGVLEETAAGLVSRLVPALTSAQIIEGLEYASGIYASKGVTTANEGAAASVNTLKLFKQAVDEGKLKIRANLWTSLEAMDNFYKFPLDTEMISRGGVKDFADGSIQGYTGYLGRPYYTHYHGDPTYRGYPRYDREIFAARVKKAHDAGHQVLVHGNGDAAIDDILYAFRKAQEATPRADTRHTVIHSQTSRDDQLDEMARLGAIPSFFVLHTYYWGDRHRDIFLGPERASRISPTKSAIERGMHFTIHTDTPIVPMDPFLLMWSAVNRISTSGAVIGAEQRITPLQALRATTIEAAYQNFEEKLKGSIETGKLADLVILSANPIGVDPGQIRDIKVVETIVGGKSVYKTTDPALR